MHSDKLDHSLRILATDGLDKDAVAALEADGYEVVQQFYEEEDLKQKVREFDVLVVRSATKVRQAVIDSAAESGRLQLIIRGGVGMDNIDVEYAREKGITVSNTPTASSASVAELAIAHMFSLARFLYISNVTMREGKWEKKAYKGTELAGKTLGLIGMGKIARETASRARGLGMHVVYTNRSGDIPDLPYEWKTLDELLEVSDYVSLHIPAKKDTPPLLDAEKIAMMKDGAFLINTARGVLVDSDALCDALDSGHLAGAAIDVFTEEPCHDERLLNHPKISLTPHIGASTKEAQKRIGEEIVKIIYGMFR